jgi:polyisoprenoid-binding protein YceI
MKGATRRISIPVTVSRARGHSTVRGEFTVDRSEFRVGEGIWSDTSLVGKDVLVRFSITLVAK